MNMKLAFGVLIFFVAVFCRAAETNEVLFSENFAHGVSNRWQQVKFGNADGLSRRAGRDKFFPSGRWRTKPARRSA